MVAWLGGGAGTVVVQHQLAEPRDDRPRDTRVLVADQIGGAGQLVRDRDHRCRQLHTYCVVAPAPIRQRIDPGAADRHVGLAEPPGAAEAVCDHHRG